MVLGDLIFDTMLYLISGNNALPHARSPLLTSFGLVWSRPCKTELMDDGFCHYVLLANARGIGVSHMEP